MKSQKISVGIVILIAMILLLSSTVPGSAMDDWQDGDEANYTGGRTFDEEFWVADYTNTTNEGYNLTSSIFYVNQSNVQAFLIAVKEISNETNKGVVPYQLFGLHYYTPKGQEVFIGAIFAFLMGYNNTYDPENGTTELDRDSLFYIIPFGAANAVNNKDYIPKTERSITKVDNTQYIFEISYKNLYAFVVKNPLWSAILKTGYVAKFSELTIRYKITLDEDKGEVRAETFYSIGQVTELWAFILGIPIPVDVTKIPETLGVAAVHYVATFTSYSKIIGAGSGKTIETGITEPTDEDLNFKIDNDERIFKIGFRGTYDLIEEAPERKTLKSDLNAINLLLKPGINDALLVLNQLGYSSDLMAIMSYGMSENLQDRFSSPRDLKQKAIMKFHTNTLWYAVAFPEWGGYRIEHDPTYTAYTSFQIPEGVVDDDDDTGPCRGAMIITLATTASVCVIGIRRRRRR
jgi:hypothetical protein